MRINAFFFADLVCLGYFDDVCFLLVDYLIEWFFIFRNMNNIDDMFYWFLIFS